MKSTFVYFLIIIFVLIQSCTDSSIPQKPNIILINVDDMGWKDVGFMGSKYYETPNIDALAKDGVIFYNGYAGASNCAPSRASLMTGLWSPRHGVYTVGSAERGKSKDRKLIPVKNTTTLAKSISTLPRILQQNDYHTIHAGKWHLSDDPLPYGFDINIGGGHNGHPKSYYPPYKNVSIEKGQNEYLTDLIMEKTLSKLNRTEKPFFLNYSPYAIHTPIDSVPDYLNKYEGKKPWKGQDNIHYATMVSNLDRNVGLLVDRLKETDQYENTMIIFTTDNGGHYGITRQYPLRAGKGSYYEGGVRVPFAITWNNNIQGDRITTTPITHLDIFPTILKLLEIEDGNIELDGQDISAILLNGKEELASRPMYWHFPIYLEAYDKSDNQTRDSLFRTRPGSVIIQDNWKLHYYFEDDGMELYNLTEDISEKNNIANENTVKRDELYSLLQEWWNKTGAPLPTSLNPGYQAK